jgi:hypothetical protein
VQNPAYFPNGIGSRKLGEESRKKWGRKWRMARNEEEKKEEVGRKNKRDPSLRSG